MLKLPDELLLNIALLTDSLEGEGVLALKALSLTCHRLHPIAQEALIRNAAVSIRHIWTLVEILGTRPILANSLTHLRLRRLDQATYDMMQEENARGKILANEDHESRVAFVQEAFPIANIVEWMEDGFKTEEAFCSFGILVVISLSPGLKKLSVCNNLLDCLPLITGLLNHTTLWPDSSIPERYKSIRCLLENQLESLELTEDQPVIKTGKFYRRYMSRYDLSDFSCSYDLVNLAHFQNLKCIVVPLSRLPRTHPFDYRHVSIQATNLSHVLPQSLESIRVDIGVRYTNFSVEWFGNFIEDSNTLPHLKHVTLRFELNMPSTAWHMCTLGTRFGQEQLDGMQRWKASRVNAKTEFGTVKFVGVREVPDWVRSDVYVEGDLSTEIKRSLATTHAQLEQEIVLLEELGYITPQ